MKYIVHKFFLMIVLLLLIRDLIPKLIINAINQKSQENILDSLKKNTVYAVSYSAAMISYYYITQTYLK